MEHTKISVPFCRDGSLYLKGFVESDMKPEDIKRDFYYVTICSTLPEEILSQYQTYQKLFPDKKVIIELIIEYQNLEFLKGLAINVLKINSVHIGDDETLPEHDILEPLVHIKGLEKLIITSSRRGFFGPYLSMNIVGKLASLKHLEICDMSLSNIEFVRRLTNLKTLRITSWAAKDIGGNCFSDLSPVGDLINLEELNLYQSTRDIDAKYLIKLKKLKKLTLTKDCFGGSGIKNIKCLKILLSLQYLSIFNDIVDGSWMESFDHMTELDLTYNDLKDLSFVKKGLPKLQKIKLSYNDNLTDEQVESLKQKRPNLDIVYSNKIFMILPLSNSKIIACESGKIMDK